MQWSHLQGVLKTWDMEDHDYISLEVVLEYGRPRRKALKKTWLIYGFYNHQQNWVQFPENQVLHQLYCSTPIPNEGK